jgi:hypothetical protein
MQQQSGRLPFMQAQGSNAVYQRQLYGADVSLTTGPAINSNTSVLSFEKKFGTSLLRQQKG